MNVFLSYRMTVQKLEMRILIVIYEVTFSPISLSFLIHHFNDFKLNAGFVFRRRLTLCWHVLAAASPPRAAELWAGLQPPSGLQPCPETLEVPFRSVIEFHSFWVCVCYHYYPKHDCWGVLCGEPFLSCLGSLWHTEWHHLRTDVCCRFCGMLNSGGRERIGCFHV